MGRILVRAGLEEAAAVGREVAIEDGIETLGTKVIKVLLPVKVATPELIKSDVKVFR